MESAANDENNWLDGELKLAGIDAKMMALLKAIDQTGSITRAAEHCGLSYKGAWQIIERANNAAPSVLIGTATGGSKGGGSALTESGRALLRLFIDLETQHRKFLAQINRSLLDNPETHLLLQRLAVKTSVRNQLFGTVTAIERGAVNAKIIVNLSDNLPVKVIIGLSMLKNLDLKTGMDALLLISPADIVLTRDLDNSCYSAANNLSGNVTRIQKDDIHSDVTTRLPNGETITCLITEHSAKALALTIGANVGLLFPANAPVLGLKLEL